MLWPSATPCTAPLRVSTTGCGAVSAAIAEKRAPARARRWGISALSVLSHYRRDAAGRGQPVRSAECEAFSIDRTVRRDPYRAAAGVGFHISHLYRQGRS